MFNNLVATALTGLEQINEFQRRRPGRGEDGRYYECRRNEFVNEEGYCEQKLDPDQVFNEWGLRVVFFTTSMNTTIPTLISFIAMYSHIINNNLPLPPRAWPWEAFSREKRQEYRTWFKSCNFPHLVI